MKPNQIRVLYNATAQSFHREVTPGEDEAWGQVFANYPEGDLDAAIRRWREDTRVDDFTHRPNGARMPTPAELKLSIDDFNSKQAQIATGSYVPCNQGDCKFGWIRVFEGRTSDGNEVDKVVGGVHRCQCFWDYCASKAGSKSIREPRENKKKSPGLAELAGKTKMP